MDAMTPGRSYGLWLKHSMRSADNTTKYKDSDYFYTSLKVKFIVPEWDSMLLSGLKRQPARP
jgi:hypothetical protein